MKKQASPTETTATAAVAGQSASPAPTPTKKASKKAARPVGKKTSKATAPKKEAKPAAGNKPAKAVASKKHAQAADGQPREGSKKQIVLDLLRRKDGATMAEIAKATDWQNHSIRGFISGQLTKRMGLTVESAKNESGERTYRIAK